MTKTLDRKDARDRTRALWEKLRDVLKNEEAWFIIQESLDEERAEAISDCVQIIEEDPTSENNA